MTRPRRLLKNEVSASRAHQTAHYFVLGRTNSAAVRALCVLVLRVAIALSLFLGAGVGSVLAGEPAGPESPVEATTTTPAVDETSATTSVPAPPDATTTTAPSEVPNAPSPPSVLDPAGEPTEPVTAVVGIPGSIRYEQNDPRLAYTGAWSADAPAAEASGGSFRYAYADASVTIQFDGTYLAWIGQKHQAYGGARVTLDGGEPVTVDLYSSDTLWNQTLWETGTLAPGAHVVIIEWTGVQNPEGVGSVVGIDAFDVVGTLEQAPLRGRYEQSDYRLAYSGAWSADTPAVEAYGGSFRYAYADASVTIQFDGISLVWIGQKHQAYGGARVTLDGGEPVTVDLYSPETLWNQALWETGTLAPGVHVVVIEWTGVQNPEAVGSIVGVDAFDVVGSLQQVPGPIRYEQDDLLLWYQGLWTDRNTTLAYGRRIVSARSPEALVTVTFAGTSLAWIAKVGPDCGVAEVVLDGSDPITVDLYGPTLLGKQKVWDTGALAEGTHTVTIRSSGTKNEAAADIAVNLDALEVEGTLVQTPPPAHAALIVFDGNSLTLGVGTTAGMEFPAQLVVTLSGGPWRAHNVAVGGQTTAAMLGDVAYQVDRLSSTAYSQRLLVCFTGSIDRLSEGNVTREENLRTYCAGRRAAGYTVIVLTLPSYLDEDYPGNEREAFNDWVRANYRDFADGLADVGADPRIGAQGAYQDGTYFADTVHLNDAGQAVVAEIVGEAIDRLPLLLRGADRYDTALKISQAAFPAALPPGSGLVLAPGETFPEALCGGPLAAAWGGPVLLTPGVGLNNAVRAEILRLQPQQVFCIGLSDAVVAAVQSALDASGTGGVAMAIRGADVYDMSYRVALALAGKEGDMRETVAIVTRGDVFPDAISVSPLACAKKWPILLTDGATGVLPTSAATALSKSGITQAIKVGSYVTLPHRVTGIANLSGADRYFTNATVAAWSEDHAGLAFDHIAVATGDTFPDALAAGPYLALDEGILLLSPLYGPVPAPVAGVITANREQVQHVTFIACIEPVIGQVKALLP